MASTSGPERLALAAEVLLGLALVVAPWLLGGAPDPARYGLTALVALGTALGFAARAWAGAPPPALLLPASGLPLLALTQLAFGLSVARVFTAEALLMLLAFLGAASVWSARAEGRPAALRLAGLVVVACVAQAAFGAWQAARPEGLLYRFTTQLVTTPYGSYVNHNHFAGLVGMGALLATGLALGLARRAGGLSPGSLALFGLAAGLFATQLASRSRGGLLASAAGLAALVALRHAYGRPAAGAAGRRTLLLAGGGGLLLAFGLGVVPAETRAHLATLLAGERDGSFAYRRDIAGDTLRLWRARPLLGSGLGAYADALPPFKRAHGEVRTTHAECDALELSAESGVLGLAALGLLAWAAASAAHAQLRGSRDPLRKGLVLGAAGGLAGLAVHSLVDFNLRLPANALVAAALLALVSAPRQPARPRSGVQAGAAALLALVSALAAWRAQGARQLEEAARRPGPQLRLAALDPLLRQHPYLAEGYRLRGRAWLDLATPASAQRDARLARAERDLARALAIRPQWGEAWAELAWARLLRGQAEGARLALVRAQGLDPTHAGLALAAAQGWLALGETARGVRTLAALVERQPAWFDEALRRTLPFRLTEAELAPLAGDDPLRRARLRQALASER